MVAGVGKNILEDDGTWTGPDAKLLNQCCRVDVESYCTAYEPFGWREIQSAEKLLGAVAEYPPREPDPKDGRVY
jgi:hypothetical protein